MGVKLARYHVIAAVEWQRSMTSKPGTGTPDTSGSYASYEVSFGPRLLNRVWTYLGLAFSLVVAGSGPGRT